MMAFTFETVEALLKKYIGKLDHGCWDAIGKYGEPGYTDPKKLILFANWNRVPTYIQEGLERRGYALEYMDEWVRDYESDKAYRCVADSHSWRPSYFMTSCGTIWGKYEWLADDRIEYFKNNVDDMEPFDLDLEPYGWYEFDCDDPGIFEAIINRDRFVEHMNDHRLDVIFQEYSGGYTRVWLKAQTDETS